MQELRDWTGVDSKKLKPKPSNIKTIPDVAGIPRDLVDIKINDFIVQGIYANNINYVPVRVLEEFGLKVDWDSKTKTVEVK